MKESNKTTSKRKENYEIFIKSESPENLHAVAVSHEEFSSKSEMNVKGKKTSKAVSLVQKPRLESNLPSEDNGTCLTALAAASIFQRQELQQKFSH